MSRTLRLALLVCVCALTLVGCGPEPVYRDGEPSAEGGTGRTYMGREIAGMMGSEHGALWLDRPERDEEELPQRLLLALSLSPSDVVADIGSGTGFFTFRLAELVPSGRVYAVEVQPSLVDTIRVRAERRDIRNVTPVLGSESNPSLPAARLDLALIVSSYHEFAYPREMLESLLAAIKPGGRLVIVEYRAEDTTIAIPETHRMSQEQIVREGEAVGFAYRESIDVLPQQHIVVFQVPTPE
jgi:precorrin-6B methylase 2